MVILCGAIHGYKTFLRRLSYPVRRMRADGEGFLSAGSAQGILASHPAICDTFNVATIRPQPRPTEYCGNMHMTREDIGSVRRPLRSPLPIHVHSTETASE